jgi:predicted membrane-bound spermidine synthase
VPNVALGEEVVHLPLLFIRQPRRTLVLSSGVGGVPHELAKDLLRVFISIRGVLLFLNALAGFLVGSQLPLANRMWLKGRDDLRGTAGVLYACDLVGAFLGSVVVSVVLVPVLGILETCLLAAMLKSGSLLLAATLTSRL